MGIAHIHKKIIELDIEKAGEILGSAYAKWCQISVFNKIFIQPVFQSTVQNFVELQLQKDLKALSRVKETPYYHQ